MRKVFLAAGLDDAGNRRTRIRIEEFAAAIKLGEGEEVEADEVECLVANMIYKVGLFPSVPRLLPLWCPATLHFEAQWCLITFQNLMKGYISRANGIVVLSKTGAFPGTRI